VDMTIMTDKWS